MLNNIKPSLYKYTANNKIPKILITNVTGHKIPIMPDRNKHSVCAATNSDGIKLTSMSVCFLIASQNPIVEKINNNIMISFCFSLLYFDSQNFVYNAGYQYYTNTSYLEINIQDFVFIFRFVSY